MRSSGRAPAGTSAGAPDTANPASRRYQSPILTRDLSQIFKPSHMSTEYGCAMTQARRKHHRRHRRPYHRWPTARRDQPDPVHRNQGAAEAIEFYQNVFGARLIDKTEFGGVIVHADIDFGTGHLQLGEPNGSTA